jgi:hypothetical protein
MKKLLASLGLTCLVLGLSFPAMAVGWGPTSSYYKGIRRVTGYGSFYKLNNAVARDRITVRDDRNDGNAVYGRATFSFYEYHCDYVDRCASQWVVSARKGTPELSNRTSTFNLDRYLSGTGSRARVSTFACAQMGWPVPDSCAPSSYPTFNY